MRGVKTLFAALLITGIALTAVSAHTHADLANGAPTTPESVVDHVVAQALSRIADAAESLDGDRSVALDIFNDEVRPYIDSYLMARFAMGPAARRADPADIERLSDALGDRVANLYAGALQRYAAEAVDFASEGEVMLRTVTQDDQRAIVSAVVRGPHVEDLTLRIQLYQREGQWRVFDIETSGVSILLVFRDALQAAAGRDGDVDAMIAALEEGAVDVEEAWEGETDETTGNQ